MVQPNQKAYSPYYMTPAAYAEWSPHLQTLAKSMKTEITFCFEEQYFDIRGRSQTACDDTMEKIVRKLLPELCDRIDDKLMMGTYEDIEGISETYSPSRPIVSSSSSPAASSPAASSPAVGRAPNLDQDKNEVEKPEKKGAYYYNETESDGSDSEEEEFVETFSFAKNVRKPTDILNVPSVGGKKPIDYLTVIGNDTDTECSLVDKTVKIVGSNEASVKEAHQRFKNLQTIYKRSKKPTSVVSCVHIQSDEDCGIYFCHLDHFAHKAHIELLSMKDAPYFVLLPVFKDERGAYQKPKDLLEASRTASPVVRAQTPSIQQQPLMQKQQQQQQQQLMQKQQQQQQRQVEVSLEERMKQATFKNSYTNAQYGMAPDQRPLWGENKNFVTNPSMQAPPPSAPRVPVNPPPIQAPKPVEDEFPALPTAPTKAPAKKGNAKRVMRIGHQKSGRGTPAVSSHVENRQKYNLHVMRTALAEGLESVRGYKGNIKLSASMGKVLWTRLQSDTQKIIWTYEKINDILIKEKGVQPTFNGLVTKDNDIIGKITDMFNSTNGNYGYYEVHARARNQPILPFKPVVIHMSQQAVDIKKVVVASHKVTEVNWNILNQKFDFQMNLQTEELTRTDVKPYSTFLKKISISPHTRQLTFEDVPDFLTVDKIYLKNTTKIRLYFPFVVEITRVEDIPLINQTSLGYNINKVLADTGSGKSWYTIEIFYSSHDEDFKRNGDLPAGKFASWTVDDILGPAEDLNGPLGQFIRCMLMFTSRSDKAV